MAAASINYEAYTDAMLVLGTAGIVVPVVRRFGISPVLGYLVAGAVLGPLGLGTFKAEFPVLRWLTVVEADNVAVIAEFGVVFLLFLIGLELSFERLKTMRRLVFGLGGMQVALTSLVLYAGLLALGQKPAAAVVLALSLALSSTAIVLELLSQQRRLATGAGRASFSILLAQDLAVIPLFLLIAILSASGNGSVMVGLFVALLQAGLAIAVIYLLGRYLLRPILHSVAGTGSTELFIAAILFIILGAGLVASLAGLSMALGAFLAGLILAETEFRKTVETLIEPFKALLLGVFFFTIGMRIDVRELIANPLAIGAAVAVLLVLKASIIVLVARLYRIPRPAAIETGLTLAPGGEFAFVGIGLATAAGLIGARDASFVLAVTSLGMALIPGLNALGRHFAGKLTEPVWHEPPEPPGAERGHTIVVGFGRMGRTVADMLGRHNEIYLATDSSASTVSAERKAGRPVYFGDATQPGFLDRCGLEHAKAVVVTIHDRAAIDRIVEAVRASRPDVTIVARARDAEHARHLYAIGVTDAVPETIEASLQLSEAALVGIGLATGPVIASIHERRDEFRHELQKAMGTSRRNGIRALRKSSRRPDQPPPG